MRSEISNLGAARSKPPSSLAGGERGMEIREPDVVVYVVAGLAFLAALAHLWATPEHLEEWWGYGAFFLTAAAAQGLFSIVLLRWPVGLPVILAGIYGNLMIVSVYVVTRTYGVPLGPSAGHQEDPGLLDMTATTAEVCLVFLLATLLKGDLRRTTINALLFLGAAIWTLRLTGVLP